MGACQVLPSLVKYFEEKNLHSPTVRDLCHGSSVTFHMKNLIFNVKKGQVDKASR